MIAASKSMRVTYCFGERGGEGEGVIMFEEVVISMLGGEDAEDIDDMLDGEEEEVAMLNVVANFPGSAILGKSLS